MKAIIATILLTVTASVQAQPIRPRPERNATQATSGKGSEPESFGDWNFNEKRDIMSGEKTLSIMKAGELAQGPSNTAGDPISFVVVVCEDEGWLSVRVFLSYLNPNNVDYGEGQRSFDVAIKFDGLAPRTYRSYSPSGGNFFFPGFTKSVHQGLIRQMGNSETMLIEVEQYGGDQVFRFPVSDFAEAEASLRKRCGIQ